MKRFLSSILALAMIFSLYVPAMAVDTAKVFVETESITAAPGEDVTFTVKVSNPGATGVASTTIALDVPEDLEFKSVASSDSFGTAEYNETAAYFSAYNADPAIAATEWTAFTVTYTIKAGATAGAKTVSVKSTDLFLMDADDNEIAGVAPGASASVTVSVPAHDPVYVAEIGSEKFETLAAAVAAAQNGDTILVKEDITLNAPLTISGEQITVNLGGKTITATSDVFKVSGGADLALTNGTIDATGIVVWSDNEAAVANTIDITGVTATSDTFVVYHNGLKYGADVTITDSTLTSDGSLGVYLAGRATVDASWPEGKNSKLTIESSTITGTSAVETKRTDVTIGEGTVLNAEGTPSMTGNKNGPASSGYALALTSNKGIAVGSATVTGGTFNGKIGIEVTEGSTNTATFAVSGGSFSEAVPEEYCADGFVPKDNGNGTYGVEVAPDVAKIGGIGYKTLEAAVNAAVNGDTIVLQDSITLAAPITISEKRITIELNEETITANSAVFMVNSGAHLTLTNGTVNATGDNGIVVWSTGNGTDLNKITLDKVDLTAEDFVVYHNGLKYGADVTIKNGSTLTSDVTAVYLAGRATNDSSWAEGMNNKLLIENATVTGASAVETKRTDVTVKAGAVLNATGTEASMVGNSNGTVSIGYALALVSNNGIARGSAIVTGGTFNGAIGIEVTENVTNTATFAVSGGSFKDIVPAEYCADGFVPVTTPNGEGKYTVEIAPDVAKIGGIGYKTLEAAVNAAVNGDTIVLQDSITLAAPITISEKRITVELNEETITATSAVFMVNSGADLTLTNGTINATGDNSIVVWSEGNGTYVNQITLDGVTLTSEDFTVYHNGMKYGADVTIKNSTLESDAVAVYLAGRATVDNKWPEGKNNTLVIENSTITGSTAVEVKRTDVTVKAGTVLNAEGTPSMTPNTSGTVSSGYALALVSNHGIAVGSAIVTGGTFNGKIGIEVTDGVTNDATFAISGGTFDEPVAADYCAIGYEPRDNGDGTYGVKVESVDSGGGSSGGAGGSSSESSAVPDPVNPFVDVKKTDYWYDAVLWAVEKGVTNGTTATTFTPTAPCTRAQMVTFLWRAAGSPEPTTKNCSFTDVDKNAYYYDAVLWAIEKGITNGNTATTFNPAGACSRAHMVTFISRSAKGAPSGDSNTFTDVPENVYYTDAVQWAVETGVTNGTTPTTFSPNDVCTRGQMVTFLYRHFEK